MLYTGTTDGYRRDQDVFAPGITIEDDLAVLVRYSRGATMTYHLTAYAPWEGYRVMVNGSKGRLELEVVETDHVAPGATGLIKGDEPGRATLRVHPHWSEPREIPIPYEREGHGGGDARMLADLLGAGPPSGVAAAEAEDGARALRIGLAANESIASGLPVRIRHDA
ncbi:Gfo/Idh/MocA family oxidoreductase [Dactylosporangium cerinum]